MNLDKTKIVRVDPFNFGSGLRDPGVYVQIQCEGETGVRSRYLFGKKGEESLTLFDAIKQALDLTDSRLLSFKFLHTTATVFDGKAVSMSFLGKAEAVIEYGEKQFTGYSLNQYDLYVALAEAFLNALLKARS